MHYFLKSILKLFFKIQGPIRYSLAASVVLVAESVSNARFLQFSILRVLGKYAGDGKKFIQKRD